jgi:hypothetical protein
MRMMKRGKGEKIILLIVAWCLAGISNALVVEKGKDARWGWGNRVGALK